MTSSVTRRMFLGSSAGAGLAVGTLRPAPALAQARRYDPDARYELSVEEVEYRRTPKGRALLARIYRPSGRGPFPVVIDLHGGGWNAKDRTAEQPFDRAIAGSGVLVIAVDMTRAPEAPYPAAIQDAHFAVRWVKANAARWGGNLQAPLGVFASSSGGHIAELLVLRSNDPLYAAVPYRAHPRLQATVDYLVLRSPVSDTWARYQNAADMKNADMVRNNTNFFVPFDTIHSSNPYEIVIGGRHGPLKPMLIMQGALDDNVRPAAQQRFVEAYRAAGGSVDFEVFPGSEHEWVAKPGLQTDRAHAMARRFIARQVNGVRSGR